MKTHRAVAIVLLAFLAGGSSAEMAVQTRRALHRSHAAPAEGSGGNLLALELRDPDGQLIARPRLLATPGRAAHLVLRDPRNPEQVRLTLRLEANRDPSGDVSVEWELTVPGEQRPWSGRLLATPGVELALDLGNHLGDRPVVFATLLALPVPSAAFDAFMDAERRARHT